MTIILTFIVNVGLNFVLGLFIARFLGPQDFGRYAVAAAVAAFINALFFDWLRLSASRFYSDRSRREEPTVRATLDRAHATIALCLVGILAIGVAGGVDFRLPTPLLAAAVAAGICSSLFDYHGALARARFQERTYGTIVIVKNVMAFVLMVGGAFLYRSATVVLVALCLSVAASLAVARGGLVDPAPSLGQARLRLARDYARYSLPLVAAVTIYLIIPLANRAAVAAYYGYAEAGQFSLAFDLGIRIFAAAGSALDILLFQLAVRADELHGRDAARRQIGRNAMLVFAVMVPTAAGYWLVLPSFEALFVPAAFRGAFAVYTAILIPSLFAFAIIQFALNPVFQLAKRTAPVVAAAVVALVVNGALALILSPSWGAQAMALAQVGGMLGALATGFFLANRVMPVAAQWRDMLAVIVATAAMMAMLAPFRGGDPPVAVLAGMILLGAAAYLGLLVALNVLGLRQMVAAGLAARRPSPLSR